MDTRSPDRDTATQSHTPAVQYSSGVSARQSERCVDLCPGQIADGLALTLLSIPLLVFSRASADAYCSVDLRNSRSS